MKNCWKQTQILIENHLIFVFSKVRFSVFVVRKKVFYLLEMTSVATVLQFALKMDQTQIY